ncbi:LysR family transcriptional regulator [Alsobacter sp. SYSU M60028]|uniref:LysR family transcriptional regulator n=1 Tax=Alsobacter ponti TaxID=2962936 RepID=A0ABT1LGC9_9HYPH|nr:LysR family transcriptional regulator [Alsobacter ponti]MCP8940136.1 LysR family transcriptional regulator [Alsobacter ponti]
MLHAAALTYFREVARARSIRRAAASLNVAASALNRQILKLEADFGTPLFDRLPGGMRLTTAGELLLRHVSETLHDFDRIRAEIDDLKLARSGHVSIAAVDSLLVDFLPRAIDRFRADFPAVNYTVTAVGPTDVVQMVAAGEVDFGFTFVSGTPASVRFLAEVPAPIGAVMRADHPLASRLVVSLEEASSYPLLTQTGPLPRASEVDPAFAAFKDALTPRLMSNSIQMLKLAIMLNMGVAFFTRLGFLSEIEAGTVAWRPMASPGINKLRLGLLAPSARAMSPPAEQLARRLADGLSRLGNEGAGYMSGSF